MDAKQVAPRRGRPRDPQIAPRVFAAAIEVYSARGWSGFTLEEVARTAKVGNAAIYLRWTSKAELLTQAAQAQALGLEDTNTGTSRGDLLELGRQLLRGYRASAGIAGLRLLLDARTNPELARGFELERTGPRRAAAESTMRRIASRQELAPSFTPSLALEMFAGVTLMHVLYQETGASSNDSSVVAVDEAFLSRIVDVILVTP